MGSPLPAARLWESMRSGVRLLQLLARLEKAAEKKAAEEQERPGSGGTGNGGTRVAATRVTARRGGGRRSKGGIRRVRMGKRRGAARENVAAFVAGCKDGALHVKVTLKSEDLAEAAGGAPEAGALRLLESLETLRDVCEARDLRPAPSVPSSSVGKRAKEKENDHGRKLVAVPPTKTAHKGGSGVTAGASSADDAGQGEDDGAGMTPSSESMKSSTNEVFASLENISEENGSVDRSRAGDASPPLVLPVGEDEAADDDWVDMAVEMSELREQADAEDHEYGQYLAEMAPGDASLIDDHY